MPNELTEIVRKNIVARSEEIGISQKYLAGLVGLTPESLSKIRTGKMSFRLERLADFARALRCTPAYLVEKHPGLDTASDPDLAQLALSFKSMRGECREVVLRLAKLLVR